MVVGSTSDVTGPLPDDPALLKALIAVLQAENAKISATLRAHDQLIQTLRLRITKLKKQVLDQSWEKIEREIEQLELALEDLLIAIAESATGAADDGQDDNVSEPTAGGDAADHRHAVAPGSRKARYASGRSLIPAVAVPVAVVICAWWARMSARCWI